MKNNQEDIFMKGTKISISMIFALIFIMFAGCDWRDIAPYDITGTWQYIQFHENDNNQSYVYAQGTLTFIGDRDRGTYTGVCNHGHTFRGNYHVRVARIFLTGDITWTGMFIDNRKIEGTWLSAGAVYEWEAIR